jgi:hypothetical protein
MYCSNCGESIDLDVKYCIFCGTQTDKSISVIKKNSNIKSLEIKLWPLIVTIIILVITIFPWDYAFYMVSKVGVCAAFIYYCFVNYKKGEEKQSRYFWYFLVLAILFNPVIPIHLFYRFVWILVDLVVIVFLFNYYSTLKKI